MLRLIVSWRGVLSARHCHLICRQTCPAAWCRLKRRLACSGHVEAWVWKTSGGGCNWSPNALASCHRPAKKLCCVAEGFRKRPVCKWHAPVKQRCLSSLLIGLLRSCHSGLESRRREPTDSFHLCPSLCLSCLPPPSFLLRVMSKTFFYEVLYRVPLHWDSKELADEGVSPCFVLNFGNFFYRKRVLVIETNYAWR